MDDCIKDKAQELFSHLRITTHQLRSKWTFKQCFDIAPLVLEIQEKKKDQNIVILAHSYTSPEIIYGVADFVGDSFELALKSKEIKEQTVIFAGVYFMAETAKIISPDKNIYIPSASAGCSLADSITPKQLKELKEKHKQAQVVCYINSNAEIKALSDICVTSSNVYDIMAKVDSDEVIFIPDSLMAENIRIEMKRRGIRKHIVSSDGTCCVHDHFSEEDIDKLRQNYPEAKILTHPESHHSICALCDFVGGTKGMMEYVKNSNAKTFAILSEMGILNRLEHDNPDKIFISPIRTCGHMKQNTLDNIHQVLNEPKRSQIVTLDDHTIIQAKVAIDRMFEYVNRWYH